jgi:hypothetical protein
MISLFLGEPLKWNVAHLVDVPLHATCETCLTDWAATRRMLIARAASQTLGPGTIV